MTKSDSIKDLASALAIAQGAIGNAAKDSANPFFNSSYADLASVRDAIREPFSANGLSVMQFPAAEDKRVTITTILAHKSGEWIADALTMSAKDASPQAIGSAITYARRYALAAVAGVAPEDDDGEKAEGRETATSKDAAPQKKASVPPKPWDEQFKDFFLKVGPAEYGQLLGSEGYESARDIPNQQTAKKVLDSMKRAHADRTEGITK